MDTSLLREVFDKFGSECSVSIASAPAAHRIAQNGISWFTLETNFLNCWATAAKKHKQVTKKNLQDAFDEARFKRDLFINFDQFQDALQILSRLCYPHLDPDIGYLQLVQDITSPASAMGLAQKRHITAPNVKIENAKYIAKTKTSPKKQQQKLSPTKTSLQRAKVSKRILKI
ncbi:hypothetical protein HDV06_004534 [Boothiomyces sp. JEL0866]|nr:hypothetical protein HDV06_004534 [Boothiomyces sp. JEL0866]